MAPKPISYIDKGIVGRTLSNYNINPMFNYLSGLFGNKETMRIFNIYKVGTAKKWGGSTVYWQIDYNGNVRTGKIMLYDSETGHIIKEPRNYITWVHTALHYDDFNLKQCFFGEHLLSVYPNKSVDFPVCVFTHFPVVSSIVKGSNSLSIVSSVFSTSLEMIMQL